MGEFPSVGDPQEVALVPIARRYLASAIVVGTVGFGGCVAVGLYASFLHVEPYVVVLADPVYERGASKTIRAGLLTPHTGEVAHVEGMTLQVVAAAERLHCEPRALPASMGWMQCVTKVPPSQVGEVSVVVEVPGRDPQTFELQDVTGQNTQAVGQEEREFAEKNPAGEHDKVVDVTLLDEYRTGFPLTLAVRVLNPSGLPSTSLPEVMLEDGQWSDDTGKQHPVLNPVGQTGIFVATGRALAEAFTVLVRSCDAQESCSQTRVAFRARPGVLQLDAYRNDARRFSISRLAGKPGVLVDVFDAAGRWRDSWFAETDSVSLSESVCDGVVEFQVGLETRFPGRSTATGRTICDRAGHGLESRLANHFLARSEQPILDTNWLAHIEANQLAKGHERWFRRYLLDAVPREVHSLPLLYDGRQDEEARVALARQTWRTRFLALLYGGGGTFLATMLLLMAWTHRQAARAMTLALGADEQAALRSGRRAFVHAAVRAGLLFVLMAGGLAMVAALFDALLWVHE